MNKAYSKDGTAIAFDQFGTGPALILVPGALNARSNSMQAQLIRLLEPHFTVISYDRRGRGDSGDTQPYAVEREIEDLEAVIDAAGGSAFLFGTSSGATLALEATNTFPAKVTKLALHEPPILIDDSRPPVPADYVDRLETAIAAGRRGDAVELFMQEAVGVPAEFLAPMRADPMWAAMEQLAHTLPYDGLIARDFMAGKPLPSDRWTSATVPTLVIDGELSAPFFRDGVQALAELLPQARRRTLAGQNHGAGGDALAPVLVEFFKS